MRIGRQLRRTRFEPDAMESRNSFLYWVAAFVVLAGTLLVLMTQHHGLRTAPLSSEQSQSQAPVSAGKKAGDFKLEALGGRTGALEGARGQAIFLPVWATWGGPRRAEIPSMLTPLEGVQNNKKFV